MARETYVLRNGELVPKWQAAPREDNAAPYVRTDGMDALKSMADGKTYDSKSAYYASVKRADCEIVGNDRAGFGPRPDYRPQGVREAMREAIQRLS